MTAEPQAGSRLSCQHTHSPCLLGCLSVSGSAVMLLGTWCAGQRWASGQIISFFKCKAPWKAWLQWDAQPSQHFSEKPFAELCYMHCFLPARKRHYLAMGFYDFLCVFSILLINVVQHFLFHVLHLTDRSQPCTHRDSEDTHVGYAVKWICSVGSWHLSHPLALMEFFPSVDMRCITVPFNPVMWPLKYIA